jgi:hypothetical protein
LENNSRQQRGLLNNRQLKSKTQLTLSQGDVEEDEMFTMMMSENHTMSAQVPWDSNSEY